MNNRDSDEVEVVLPSRVEMRTLFAKVGQPESIKRRIEPILIRHADQPKDLTGMATLLGMAYESLPSPDSAALASAYTLAVEAYLVVLIEDEEFIANVTSIWRSYLSGG